MTINLDQPSEINTNDFWSQYAKLNLALATTLIGAMLIKPVIASSPSLLNNDAASTDTAVSVLDNSQQLINPQEIITFTDNSHPVQRRHVKRAGFGGEFQINTYTTDTQKYPSIAALTTDDFVVVWVSDGQDGDDYGIYGQRYSSTGIPQDDEFQINTYTVDWQWFPSITPLTTGDFVVTWQSDGQDGDSYGIYGQRFSSTAVPQGNEFQINTYTVDGQWLPSIATLSTGNFVVVWQSYGQDGNKKNSNSGIYGQRFASTAIPLGGEFQVNSYVSDSQFSPSVTALSTSDFVVVWESNGQDGDRLGIYGQRFSSTGVPQDGEFQINTYTVDWQQGPSIAALSTGDFVVTWESTCRPSPCIGQDGDSYGIYGQRFSSTAVPQGSEFQVNTYTIGSQGSHSIAALPSGDFVVVWASGCVPSPCAGQDGSNSGVYGQRFSSTGVPQGNEFQINTYTRDSQNSPSIAALSTGEFAVVWASWEQNDYYRYGVFGRIYLNGNAPPILMKNRLRIDEGETVILDTENLMIMDSDHNNTDLVFAISNVIHGNFERVANAGVPITSFTQQELTDSAIQFVHDGSEISPSYEVSVSDGILTDGPFNAAISFYNNVNDSPQIATNAIPVKQGETVLLTSSMLLAIDPDNNDAQIQFIVTNMQHGRFERIDYIGAAISDFTQEEVLTGKIQFVHDDSETLPSFDIAVTDGTLTTLPIVGNVIYNNINNAPYFTNIVSLLVQEGQTVTLTPTNLKASDIDYDDLSLVFTVSDVTHGQFESSNNPDIAITSFTQLEIQNGEISFVHDGSIIAPSFFISVSDGVFSNSNGQQAAAISFTPLNDTPIITLNTLTINEGDKVTLTSANLQATDEEIADGSLTFNVANIEHGQFENINNPGVAITSFSQQSIINGDIQFVHNGDEQAPNYAVSITDGLASSAPQAATINFTPVNDAPTLLKNELIINQDATKLLSRLNIEVIDDDNPPNELTITATNIKNGFFSTIDAPNTPITQFTQQDINDGKIQFTQQGNEKPTYTLVVTDKDGATSTQNPDSTEPVANINFVPKAASGNPVPIVAAIAGGTALLTCAVTGGIVYFKKAQDRKTRQQHKFAQLIRRHLKLQNVDNFESEDGQRFVERVQSLGDLLHEEQGIDIANMDENRLNELARNIATSAKNKINPNTTKFFSQSKITVTEFAENIEQIARDNRLSGLVRNADDINIPMHTIDNTAGNNFGTLVEDGINTVRNMFSPKMELV